VIIIAGELRVDAADRARYLDAVAGVARLARAASGCLDFVQAADPIEPDRINVYERWESDDHLHRFRDAGGPSQELPALRSADVRKYRTERPLGSRHRGRYQADHGRARRLHGRQLSGVDE